jgi:hypothetical protein
LDGNLQFEGFVWPHKDFLQELHWSKLQAVMVVVLQVLPQVQAAHCVREFV